MTLRPQQPAGTPGVDLWCFSLAPMPGELAWLSLDLSEAERRRADQLTASVVRRRFIAARAGLRRILARYADAAPASLVLRTGEHGKPNLRGGPEFNLSHSGDLALCAVGGTRPVGVDVEELRPVPEALAIAERHLGPEATRSLREGGPVLASIFLRHWTRREAYLKALGVGLAVEAPPALDPDRWEVHELTPAAGYIGALVVARA